MISTDAAAAILRAVKMVAVHEALTIQDPRAWARAWLLRAGAIPATGPEMQAMEEDELTMWFEFAMQGVPSG